MKILFAASECAPFVKTGGLADVVSALPRELSAMGEDVAVVMPLYREMSDEWRQQMEHVMYFYVNLGWRRQYCGVEKLIHDGVTYYFLDNEYYFNRPYVYGLGGDEGERFMFFSRSLLTMLPLIKFIPDILHLNDWQTGLVPALLKSQFSQAEGFSKLKTVFTIHNLQYQGIFPAHYIEELASLSNWGEVYRNMEFFGQCSFMKAGLNYSDYITTVSPTYAKEIQTAFYGEGLDGLLREKENRTTGVLNGIDTDEYNPETDPSITKNYNFDTYRKGKAACKLALQRQLELDENAATPLIGMVTRLSGQKGLDIVERVINELVETGAQLAVLGMGEDRYIDMLNWAQWKYAGKVAARIEMNHGLAHAIYAGSDIFLMPSKFEPCGLSQMIALRYGALPVVRETGGLRDTVLSYNKFNGEGNGFTFLNYNAHDMLNTARWAVGTYLKEPIVWNTLVKRAMHGEYSWKKSAKVYLDIYRKLNGG